MSLNTASKKILLAGTALVAFSFASQAHAANLSLTGASTWALDAGNTGSEDAVAGDNINVGGNTLTVTNDGTASDDDTNHGDAGLDTAGDAIKNTFTLGAVTGVAGTVNITTGSANNLTVGATSVIYTGAGSVNVSNADANNAGVAVTVGAITNVGGGAITVTNTETDSAKTVTLTTSGVVTNTGTTTITGGNFAGADTTVTLGAAGGNTFTGAVDVNAGTAGNASLKVTGNGGTTAFNGGLTLNDAASPDTGVSTLEVSGNGAKTINGAISGAAAGEGAILTNSADLTTFGGAIGGTDKGLKQITLQGTGGTTFSGTTRATTITASNGSGTNTFTGAVNATTLAVSGAGVNTLSAASTITNTNFTAAGTVNVNADLTGNVDFGGVDGAHLNIADGKKVIGNIDSTEDHGGGDTNGGVVTFAGGSTFAGTLGATNNIVDIVANGADDTTVNLNGVVNADALHIGAGTVNLGATTANSITTTTFTDAGALISVGDLTGNIDFDGNAGTVTIASGKSIDGNVDDGDSDGNGTLVLSGGEQEVNGDIGVSHVLLEVKAGQTADAVTTFNGNLGAQTITVGPGTVKLDDNKGFTGDIDAAAAGAGTFVFEGASSSTDGNIGVLHALKALTFAGSNKTVTLTNGNVVAAKTIDLGDNTLVLTNGTYAQAAGDTLISTIKGTDGGATVTVTSYGRITSGGTATIAAGSTVQLNIDSALTSAADTGDTFDVTVVNGTGGTVGAVTLKGSALWTLTQATPGDEDLVIHGIKKDIASVVSTPNGGKTATALQAAVTGGATELQDALDNVNGATTAAELNEAIEALQPTVDGSAQQGALAIGSSVTGITSQRLASMRSGDGLEGVAAGTTADGRSLWAQGFASHGEQDERGGIDGYDSDIYGGALGFDTTELLDNAVLGFALSYGNVQADSDNATRTGTDIDSYGVSLYGSFGLPKELFLDASVGYAYNDIDTVRHDTDGASDSSGSTHSDQYTARAALGRDYVAAGNTILTPTVSANYTHLDTAGYQETGPGAANLSVEDSDIDSLKLGLDLSAAWKLKSDDGSTFKPSVHAGYSWDAVGDNISNTSSFVAGGPAFQTEGASPERSQGIVDAGVTYYSTQAWDLSANYNYTFRSDYDEHAGVLRVTSHF